MLHCYYTSFPTSWLSRSCTALLSSWTSCVRKRCFRLVSKYHCSTNLRWISRVSFVVAESACLFISRWIASIRRPACQSGIHHVVIALKSRHTCLCGINTVWNGTCVIQKQNGHWLRKLEYMMTCLQRSVSSAAGIGFRPESASCWEVVNLPHTGIIKCLFWNHGCSFTFARWD